MIVFTISHNSKDITWVTSTRTTPEERWEQLINQAQEIDTTDAPDNDIFKHIIANGQDHFHLAEWGYGENASEVRQLTREAQQELGAQPIVSGKGDLSFTQRKKLSDKQAMDLLNSIEKKLDMPTSESLTAKESPSQKTTNTQITSELHSEFYNSTPKVTQVEPLQLPTGRVSSSAKEKKIREAIEKEREQRAATRSAEIAGSAREMNHVIASIEARRKAMKEARANKAIEERKKKQAQLRKAAAAQKEAEANAEKLKAEKPKPFKSSTLSKTNANKAHANQPEQPKPALSTMESNITTFVTPQIEEEAPLSREEAISAAKLLARLIRAKHARRYGSALRTG